MAPLVPRMHLFEIDDQPWWHPFLRTRVQDTLAHTWNTCLPIIQTRAPAAIAGSLLIREFDAAISRLTFVDFCAGAGGPTPGIERAVNEHLQETNQAPVDFTLTDIHPNISAWDRQAKKNPHITYEPESVDASQAPSHLVNRSDGRRIVRLFNLAFHHFDDPMARRILKDTVNTSEGFAIFELQDRSFAAFVATLLVPIGVMLAAPYYAWKWRSPATFIFTWVIPLLPLVLLWDGWISSLRTRTPEEVEVLLRSCGTDSSNWELQSGSELFIWPFAYLNWVIGKPVKKE